MHQITKRKKETRLTWWKQSGCPGLNFLNTNIKARTNDTTFVQPSIQFNHYFTSSMIINIFKLSNVAYNMNRDSQNLITKASKERSGLTMLLHNQEKLYYHFWWWPYHDLPLPSLFSIVHALKSIIQDTDSHHLPPNLRRSTQVRPWMKYHIVNLHF